MAAPHSWATKPKATVPPHYYSGFLEKRNAWEKEYKKYWAGLRELSLYFYNTSRDAQHVEKIDLADFLSVADENPPRTVAAWPTDGVGLNLKTRSQEVKLKMESLESRELWKGFILTVVEMKVPTTLSLLPGHFCMLSEALEKEKERRSKADMRVEKPLPDCFFKVSRTEAEVLLEKNENCGNMLLRPGGDGKSVSVTTRLKANGIVSIKHYKINLTDGEYIIDVEEPFRCSSLDKVVEFFVNSSKRILVPLSLDESYSMTLEIMETDKESGETALVAPRMPGILPRPPRAGAAREGKNSQSPKGLLPPPPFQPAIPARTSKPEHVYEAEDVPDQTYVNDEDVAEMRQTKPFKEFKAVPVFPTPGKSPCGPSPRKTGQALPSRLAMSLPRSFSTGMTEELERKLQERRATLQED
uniref:Signal transducing adaptor family member 2 n=1 Tax=Podarcis muralis TaxID=64176 RepID=A0A670KBG5_PODMU|nr:signal-transducing adaptor protein 2 isoform X1 [Podarcis muralis]